MINDASVSQKIDLNQAGVETLAKLPGVGQDLAARIVQYRKEVQLFEETIQVIAVPGISEGLYRQFADLIMVSAVDGKDEESAVEILLEMETDAAEPRPEAVYDDQEVESLGGKISEGETIEPQLDFMETVSEATEGAEEAAGYIITLEETEEAEEIVLEALPDDEAVEEAAEGFAVLDDVEEAEEAVLEALPDDEAVEEAAEDFAVLDDVEEAAEAVRPWEHARSESVGIGEASDSFWHSWPLMVAGALLGAFIALAVMFILNKGSLVTAVHPKIRAFENNIENLKQQEAALDSKTVELADKFSEYDSLNTRLQMAETEVEILGQARDALMEEVAALEGQIDDQKTKIATLETQASTLEKQLGVFEQGAQKTEKAVNQLQQVTGRFDSFLTGLSELLLMGEDPAAATPTIEPTDTATSDTTEESTPEPSETPVEESSETPTVEPTGTVVPDTTEESTPEPSETPVEESSETPTVEPTGTVVPDTAEESTPEPSETPAVEPTATVNN